MKRKGRAATIPQRTRSATLRRKVKAFQRLPSDVVTNLFGFLGSGAHARLIVAARGLGSSSYAANLERAIVAGRAALEAQGFPLPLPPRPRLTRELRGLRGPRAAAIVRSDELEALAAYERFVVAVPSTRRLRGSAGCRRCGSAGSRGESRAIKTVADACELAESWGSENVVIVLAAGRHVIAAEEDTLFPRVTRVEAAVGVARAACVSCRVESDHWFWNTPRILENSLFVLASRVLDD